MINTNKYDMKLLIYIIIIIIVINHIIILYYNYQLCYAEISLDFEFISEGI